MLRFFFITYLFINYTLQIYSLQSISFRRSLSMKSSLQIPDIASVFSNNGIGKSNAISTVAITGYSGMIGTKLRKELESSVGTSKKHGMASTAKSLPEAGANGVLEDGAESALLDQRSKCEATATPRWCERLPPVYQPPVAGTGLGRATQEPIDFV